MARPIHLINGCSIVALFCAVCWADGGAVRAIERDGRLQISVFTSPNPLVAGPADISVLVQHADTLATIEESKVDVSIVPRGRTYAARVLPATHEAATNKLFRACLVELEPGWYDIEVACDAADSRGRVRLAIEVGPAAAQMAVLWPWFTWPAIPVALFGVHLLLSRKCAAKGRRK